VSDAGIPVVSIIISSYNYAGFLPGAIDSALAQTYPATEVIVVDDGSTDGSRHQIARYGTRITAILKSNGGQASSLNAGFAASRGRLVCFLDSDDRLLPTAVERAVELFEPGVAKVHGPLWIVDAADRMDGRLCPEEELPEGDLGPGVLRDGPDAYRWPPTSGNVWARHFLERVCPIPEPEYVVSPDQYLCTLAMLYGLVRRLAEPVGWWRLHGENQTTCLPFEERLRVHGARWDHACEALATHATRLGHRIDPAAWHRHSWHHRLRQSLADLGCLIADDATFVLVDGDRWGAGPTVMGRRRWPFLERDGVYWGPPPDSETAIRELERLRAAGARYIVFAWPAFWWLDHYAGFHRYVRARFPARLENERLILFELAG
jgi:glycosyl transferase family 2